MSGTKVNVLLVDDEKDITTLMRLGLEKHGFSVDTYNNPTQVLTQFKPGYYDSIVLDVRMPGVSGFELAKAIWTKDPHARICFLSAFEIYESEAQKVFRNFKTHCFVKKPITPNKLIQHIEAHLMPAK